MVAQRWLRMFFDKPITEIRSLSSLFILILYPRRCEDYIQCALLFVINQQETKSEYRETQASETRACIKLRHHFQKIFRGFSPNSSEHCCSTHSGASCHLAPCDSRFYEPVLTTLSPGQKVAPNSHSFTELCAA